MEEADVEKLVRKIKEGIEEMYCPHCEKEVELARSNWSLVRKICYGFGYFIWKRKNKCSICGKKIK